VCGKCSAGSSSAGTESHGHAAWIRAATLGHGAIFEHRAHGCRVQSLETVVVGRHRVPGCECVGEAAEVPRGDQPAEVGMMVLLELRQRRRSQQQHRILSLK
jgi:hypothetical protein